MKIRWLIFFILFIPFLLLELDLLYNSWYESHYHGYDGGYFLNMIGLGAICFPVFSVWSILNYFIDDKKDIK